MINHPVQYELHICIDHKNPNASLLTKYYENLKTHYDGDSGIDLITPTSMQNSGVHSLYTIDFGIKCAMFAKFYDAENQVHRIVPSGFFLLPRSSFSSSGYIFANSVGLIDSGYRGNIKAKVLNILPDNLNSFPEGSRYFQIVAPNLQPLVVMIVDSLPPSERGSGGFGSTGK